MDRLHAVAEAANFVVSGLMIGGYGDGHGHDADHDTGEENFSDG